MGKKLLVLLLTAASFISYAQTRPGSLRGNIKDKKTGEGIPFANITIKDQGGANITGGSTDFDGNYNINPVAAGTYDVVVSVIGYATINLDNIVIAPNTPTYQNFDMQEQTSELEEVTITYTRPLIEDRKVVDREDIVNMATRDVASIAAQSAGVTQDANGNVNVRGQRAEGTVYFVDGVKMRGAPNLPQAAIEQTEVISGGVPAQYGDAIGGIINTTTRGPQSEYFGTAEYLTSALFDQQDYHLGALTLGGPLFKNTFKDEQGSPLVGFLFASEFQWQKDPNLYAIPYAYLNDDTLAAIEATPIRISPLGTTVNYSSEYVTEDALTDVYARPNSYNNQIRLTTNLQFKTSKNTVLTVGGRWNYSNDMVTNYTSHIFNYDNNQRDISSEWVGLVRFQQTFRNDPESTSDIKNAFYTIQADYTRSTTRRFDGRYEDNYFAYGNTGYYDIKRERAYSYASDTLADGRIVDGFTFVGLRDTAVIYTPGNYNPILSNYISEYYRLSELYPALSTQNLSVIQGQGMPINGQSPNSVYGLWASPGAVQTSSALGVAATNYQDRQSQFRVTASTSFDYKSHSIILGFEYEQRIDRAWALNANTLWTQMRLLQNRPNSQLDVNNAIGIFDEQTGVYLDTIEYNYLYSPDDASQFSESIRTALGLNPTGVEQINIDNLDPDMFSLDMFSPDEIINPNGTKGLGYYGYDYLGNVLDYQPQFVDFFNERDENGRYTRPVGAFRPIYMAGYVQDQFSFNDLRFNIGVRVDRLDLNQQVLRDPYIFYPYYTVGELASSPLSDQVETIPSSIGQDFAVYLSSTDYANATIVGYRSGDQFYDASGQAITNTLDLANLGGGSVQPFLKNPEIAEGTERTIPEESFVDYEPQTVVMPRVSFNFPITDEAMFIAHYDLLAQRPSTGLSRLNPFDYLDLIYERSPGTDGITTNPNLKAQKTTDYEVGFRQVLTKKSVIKIAAFYRELRDLLQTVNFPQAYPRTYIAYGNRDFGTVKGFSLEYEMRRTNNIKLDANYTLQFANGTGSSATTGANLARAGQPNLRYLQALDYDNRHQILVRLDYRFGSGSSYDGPVWWNKRVLENFGVNIVCNALSGRPYTKRDRAYNLTASASQAQIVGQINGSRLPWQVTFDARINKLFNVTKKGDKNIEVYVQIFNLLNTENVISVYPFTGSANDDGFLASETGQTQAAQQTSTQSYLDLYNRRLNSPFNISLPRRIRLGVAYNF